MEFKTFNLNHHVKFRLGVYGEKVLKAHKEQFRNLFTPSEFENLYKPDDDGLYTMQMHQMIKIFGGDKFAVGSLCVIENCLIGLDPNGFLKD